MKILLILGAIALAIWLIRAARHTNDADGRKEAGDRQDRQDRPAQPGSGAVEPEPLKMLQCAQCGVHLPGAEAIAGRQGSYCSAEHRQRAEG